MTCLGRHRGAGDRRRHGLGWGAAVVLAGLAWSHAASVRAEASRFTVSVDGSPVATCQLLERTCTTDGACETGESCVFVPGDETSRHCTRTTGASRDIYCCNPEHGSYACAPTGGTCTTVADEIAVCVDPEDPRELCVEGWGSGALTSCFVSLTGAPTRDWLQGDCDRDGVKNGIERTGCVCDADPACGVEPDAGVPDAGAAADGGANIDAGSTDDRDSGPAVGLDAGARSDAGSGDVSRDPGHFDYRGSGGCTCQAADPGSAATWLLLGFAVLVGRALRRRASR